MLVELSAEDIGRLTEALDSHVYWQLSPAERRRDGYVMDPLTDEEKACQALETRLSGLLPKQEPLFTPVQVMRGQTALDTDPEEAG